MSGAQTSLSHASERAPDAWDAALRVCERIAPTWPLDRFIAVNPWWFLTDRPLPALAAELSALSGAQLLMPRRWFRDAWAEDRFSDDDVRAALDHLGSRRTPAQLRRLVETDAPRPRARRCVADLVDRDTTHEARLRDLVRDAISAVCASFFDEGRARVGPDASLYETWRRIAIRRGLGAGIADGSVFVRELPARREELVRRALSDLRIPMHERERYLWALLLDVNGWASWCAYRRWTARLAGEDDDVVADLLAIRLAYEWVTFHAQDASFEPRWTREIESWGAVDAAVESARDEDWALQIAMERAYHEPLAEALGATFATPSRPAHLQAVFCIDVRSEVIRRALEGVRDDVQTIGFAGFFGLPLEHRPLGAADAEPRLPGLLAPRIRAEDVSSSAELAHRWVDRRKAQSEWDAFRTGLVSSFSYVEALGLASAVGLIRDSLGLASDTGLSRDVRASVRPRLIAHTDGTPIDAAERADLAARMLRSMSLTHDFAPIVLLVGHGSATRNNPHAASLACGACCGQSGEVSARVAADLLNAPDVREGLAARGIDVPATTTFVAALHDTITEEVALFDVDDTTEELARLRASLREAARRARRERAARSGAIDLAAELLEEEARDRSRDWAEVRPEWGLANNAAFVAARRERTCDLALDGRVFLHEYRSEEDPERATLELIMTAPLIVAHWINLQYYASTVDNIRYGSGNKVLHDVVGGHLGVFEGNGGDLRIGLPLQSLHDGEHWVHTPLRLSAFIEASTEAIDGVLKKHDKVRQLVDNEWISLFQLERDSSLVRRCVRGSWQSVG